jgi:hypothetical protein
MHWVQELMCERMFEEPLGKCTVLPPIIKPKFSSAQNCVVPVCRSCLLACARGSGPEFPSIFFSGRRPNFLKLSEEQKNRQTVNNTRLIF